MHPIERIHRHTRGKPWWQSAACANSALANLPRRLHDRRMNHIFLVPVMPHPRRMCNERRRHDYVSRLTAAAAAATVFPGRGFVKLQRCSALRRIIERNRNVHTSDRPLVQDRPRSGRGRRNPCRSRIRSRTSSPSSAPLAVRPTGGTPADNFSLRPGRRIKQ